MSPPDGHTPGRTSASPIEAARSPFGRLATAAARARVAIIALAATACALAIAYVYDMPVKTSRQALVSASEPHQAALEQFVSRFGRQHALMVVIEGGDAEARRGAVDQLCHELSVLPRIGGRALCGLSLEELAPLAVLQEPRLLRGLHRLEQGVARGIASLATEVSERLDGSSEGDETTAARSAPLSVGEPSETQLADALTVLDDQLREWPRPIPPRLAGAHMTDQRHAFDEHGYLVAGDRHVIVLLPDLDSDEGADLAPTVKRVRAVTGALPPGPVRADVTGVPALASDELELVRRGLTSSSIVATALLLVILLMALRSLLNALICLVPLAVGTLLTLALAKFVFGGLNLITSGFVSVLLGLGIDFAIYVLAHYRMARAEGHAHSAAVRHAAALAGPGIVMGAVTTVLAFLAVTLTEFTAYAQLGVIVAFGLCTMMAATFLLVPALLELSAPWQRAPAPAVQQSARTPRRLERSALLASLLFVTALLAASIGWPRLTFNARYFDFLPQTTESARALRALAGSRFDPVFANVVVDDIEQGRALAARLRALTTVAAVEAPSDMLPPLTRERLALLAAESAPSSLAALDEPPPTLSGALSELSEALDEAAFAQRQSGGTSEELERGRRSLAALRARVRALPDGGAALVDALESRWAVAASQARATARRVALRGSYRADDLPPVMRKRFAATDGSAFALYVHPRGDIWQAPVAEAFCRDVGSDGRAVGTAIQAHVHTRMVLVGFTRAALLAAVLVVVVVFVGLRRIADSMLAMVPVLAAMALTLGMMGWFGLPLDLANIVLLPLLIGIGVDAGAHVMHRMQASAAEHDGVARLSDLRKGTGAALVAASLTTMAGFAALLVGDYGGMRSLGLALTLGVGCSLLCSALLLPALLVLLGRAR